MNRPKYIEKIYALVFLCLGIAFLMTGLLSFMGFVKPTAHSSVQDPFIMGMVFAMMGLAFMVLQVVFHKMSKLRETSHLTLCSKGAKLMGTVEKIYVQKYTKYGKQSPYRIYYTYSYQGRVFHHKSYLLWDKPTLSMGDTLIVYADDFGRSTIQP